jgi:hypothetical protein
MNRVLYVAACVLLVVATSAGATRRGGPDVRVRADRAPGERCATTFGSPQASAGAFTTFVASYSFDSGPDCVTEGWTGYDFTEQTHEFWHVAGPAELDGGTFGDLLPLEGSQSMWCGAAGPVPAAEDPLLCAYATLPGYGNNWDQALCLTDCLTGAGGVVVNVSVLWDAEAGYDATSLEVDRCDNVWRPVAGGIGVWDGTGRDTLSIAVPDALHTGSLRIRFRFRSDNVWSDQDGVYDSDGAFLIDELSVTDTSGVRVA